MSFWWLEMQGGLMPFVPVGVGSFAMDVIVNFSDGAEGTLLTATKINNGTHGEFWGVWHEYHSVQDDPNTHTYIQDHDVVFPGQIIVGGVTYDGSEGQGIYFDLTGPRLDGDVYHMPVIAGIDDAIALYLVKYDTTLGSNLYNNDTFMFNGGNFSIAQFQHHYIDTKYIRMHSDGELGANIEITNVNDWVIVCVLHDATNAAGQCFVQHARTLEILGASYGDHLDVPGEVTYIRMMDYLRNSGCGEGSIKVKLLALRRHDINWPPYQITVPPPSSVSASQTATDTLTLTWASTCQIFRVERNVNAGGWTTLDAAFENNGVHSYVDATLSNGQSVQYRVTTRIGSQSSNAVTSNTVVVSN